MEVRSAKIQDVIRKARNCWFKSKRTWQQGRSPDHVHFPWLAAPGSDAQQPRGGGVSRRIEGDEREELKGSHGSAASTPRGMSLIARTAGIGRTPAELQWDLNYMLKLWTAIDDAIQGTKGAFLIYQESSLVIRAIRDYFTPTLAKS